MYVEQSSPFEASFNSGTSGLAGTVEVKVIDNDGVDVIGPTTANITEDGVSGVYLWNAPAAPATLGQYTIIWSSDGTYDPESVGSDDLVVVEASAGVLPPIPPPDDGGASPGPCTAWVTGDDVQACCSIEASSGTEFDDAADQASQLLFELSGRQFAGLCSRTVRPGCDSCSCGYQVLSRGHVIGPWDFGYPYMGLCDYCMVSCAPSRVKLSGYPVREITEVKIDGDVVDSGDYVLHQSRYLSRTDSGHWPYQQDLTLADTEDDTFSITYTYGMNPPLMGAAAAGQLACEIYKSCYDATTAADCALPAGVTRVTRQGITIEKLAFINWAFTPGRYARGIRVPGWNTGMPLVDAFLSAYNRAGLMRRPTFYAPGRRQYAQGRG